MYWVGAHAVLLCFAFPLCLPVMAMAQEDAKDWRAVIDQFEHHGRHFEPYANTTEGSLKHMQKRWGE